MNKNNLTEFKSNIHLVKYAATFGYAIDSKKSTKTSVAMRKGSADKIIISKKDHKWVYFSVFDDADNGTIIDFIKYRTGKEFKDIILELKAWNGENVDVIDTPDIQEKCFDSNRVKGIFKSCSAINKNEYLSSRGIFDSHLNLERFSKTVFQDKYKNAVFPQYNKNEISALELKNTNTNVFVKGSEKTFWQSNRFENDTVLVIAESAIDAISYHIIHDIKFAFYIAVSGSFSKQQTKMIQDIINNFSNLKEIRIITDNDSGGDKLYLKLKALIEKISYKSLVNRHSPESKGEDWNLVLKNQMSFD